MSDAKFTVSYVMERGDFVALTWALSRLSVARSALRGFLVVVIACGVFIIAGGEQAVPILVSLVSLTAPVEAYIGLALPAALLVLSIYPGRSLYLAAAAAAVYRRNAAAGQRLSFEIGEEEIVGGQPHISSRLAWPAIVRLIETPQHLFLAISRREALILPRRAFADDEAFSALAQFARTRIAASRPAAAG
jgi:hypothetical protein